MIRHNLIFVATGQTLSDPPSFVFGDTYYM